MGPMIVISVLVIVDVAVVAIMIVVLSLMLVMTMQYNNFIYFPETERDILSNLQLY